MVWAFAAIVVIVASAACGGQTDGERRETLTIDGQPPLDVRLRIAPRYDGRVTHALQRALTQLVDWLGPLPVRELTIVPAGVNAESPGVMAVETPWLSSARSGAVEASVVLAVTRQFWGVAQRDTGERWLGEGFAAYTAARLLDEDFAGEHVYESRSFSGLVPHAQRNVPIDSPDAHLTRLTSSPQVARTALALFTLERYVGWGTFQQVLSSVAERSRARTPTLTDLFDEIQAVSGRDLEWFRREAFDSDKTFDYGVDVLQTSAASRAGWYDTAVIVRRYGDAVFAGASRPGSPFRSTGPLELLVRFADGNEIREHWDGRDDSVQYDYESRSPAVSATIDPDRILWLDRNSANNQRTLSHDRTGAFAWALRWSVWMQDQLLDYAFFF